MTGFVRAMQPVQFMTEAQEQRLHESSLEILSSGGTCVRHKEALELLAGAGCKVDFETQIARIPAKLAEDCLAQVNATYEIIGRDPEKSVSVGGDRFHFNQGMGMRYADPDTWELRPATISELDEVNLVGDALESIAVIDGVQSPTDIVGLPPIMQHLECMASSIRMSGKPCHVGNMKHFDQFAIKMAEAVGVKPDLQIDVAPPITFTEESVAAIMEYGPRGWGMWAGPSGYAGATAPVTEAGLVAQWWAAVVAFVVIAKLVDANANVSFEMGGGILHPKDATPTSGTPNNWHAQALHNQLCRRYSIPITTAQGYCGESKMFDYQTGWEKAAGAMSAILSGANSVVFHGSHADEQGFSSVLQVMDDDVARAIIGYAGRPAVIDDEHLALELQLERGPAPTSFLATEHTRNHWMDDRFMPAVAYSRVYEEWIREGKPALVDRARARLEELLRSHRPLPLTGAQAAAIEDALDEAREHCFAAGLITRQQWQPYMDALSSAGHAVSRITAV
jgi:trimethylamine--corrinoid protein Co-methyltransferase